MNTVTEPFSNPDAVSSMPRTIAEFLVEDYVLVKDDSVPAHVIERAKLCFIDTIGVALAAFGRGVGTSAANVALKSSSGSATVWGAGRTVGMLDAAFANGMLAHGLDYDDTHAAAIMHSSSIVVPTAVSMAQVLGLTSRQMLVSAVIGYEVAGRLGRLAPGRFQDNGFQATAVLGVFASTAIAARALELNREQAISAFGIAGSMASGLMEYLADGSDVKQMHPGWSAQAGIRAAQLAAEGFTGPSTVFEGRFGVFRSFTRVTVDAEKTIAHKNPTWEVELMGPKPYPACLCVHAVIQCAQNLKQELVADGFGVEDISSIHCYVPLWFRDLVFEPKLSKIDVSTTYEARFSAQYSVARALLDDHIGLETFSSEKIDDPKARKIAKLVDYTVEDIPEFPEAFPAKMEIVVKNSKKYFSYVRHNLGSPGNPLTLAQYDEKFNDCVREILDKKVADELLKCIKELSAAGSDVAFFKALNKAQILGT